MLQSQYNHDFSENIVERGDVKGGSAWKCVYGNNDQLGQTTGGHYSLRLPFRNNDKQLKCCQTEVQWLEKKA